MAVMLRTVGVPSRNVTGFIGGTWNRFGRFYAVRQGDAHSWVEVYIDGRGWITYDPTPPADAAPKSELVGVWAYLRDFIEATSQRWDRHIIGYDLNQQVGIIQSLKSRYRKADSFLSAKGPKPRVVAMIAGGALGVAAIAFFAMRRRGKRLDRTRGLLEARSPSAVLATSLYEALDAAMGAQGLARAPSTPPLRHAESLLALEHPLSQEIFELTQIYLRARFGGVPIGDDEKRDFERRVRVLRTLELRARQGLEPAPARPAM
jgi:hypothetical protein